MSFLLLLVMLLVLSETPCSSSNPDLFRMCRNLFKCGEIVADFPFWGGDQRPPPCGHQALELRCENNHTIIVLDDVRYKVLEIPPEAKRIKIARKDYEGGICPQQKIRNTTINATIFDMMPGYMNLTLFYGCKDFSNPNLSCKIEGTTSTNGYFQPAGPGILPDSMGCFTSAAVPVRAPAPFNTQTVAEALRSGFEVIWKVDEDQVCEKCRQSKGLCGAYRNETLCYCQELSSSLQVCRPENKDRVKLAIGLGIAGAAIAGILLGGWGLFAIQQRKKNEIQSKTSDLALPPSSRGRLSTTTASTNQSQSIISYSSSYRENGSTYFGVQVFTYTELQEATDNFNTSRELGDGGFGTVYYGVLKDSRIVAVKRLYENNLKRVEQFKNEIKILADIRHPNLVTLYGCTSRHSRELLLVYEYIPNGTVADHLHGRRARSCPLLWPIRLSIAIETANALAYLHSRDIIHRDVKTNNILLDSNFRVKVADFGLSRLFPNDVTHVSTAPQGTPGYVDPEYFQCYHLTEKSDVYSLGVVLAELISAKEAVDVTRHRHDINLASMAVSRIQNRALHELVDPRLDFENDCDVRRMVTSMAELAFWCLQQERGMRPSMEEVLEVLRGMWDGELRGQVAEVVDVAAADDVGPLRHVPPPLSPDSGASDKWVQIKTM